ncbi:hypothetical protein MTO96_005654 [Rhipicephalus appendiculatus]
MLAARGLGDAMMSEATRPRPTTFEVWIEESEEKTRDGTTTKVYKLCLKAVSGVSGLLKKMLKWVFKKLIAFTR